MPIFNDKEVAAAKGYKYNGEDAGIFKKLFLGKYWDACMHFIPMSMAPNTITFIGFLFEVFSFIVSFYFTNGLKDPCPDWVCINSGVCLFIYQTLDNLDGRQARRTKSSSPLGQFFDHGCDAITGVVELMKVCASFSFGNTKTTFFFVFLMGVGFFLTSWEEYVTHHFYLGVVNGPDEGLLALAVLHVLAPYFPQIRTWAASPYAAFLFLVGDAATIFVIVKNVIRNSKGKAEMKARAVPSLIPCFITFTIFISLYIFRPHYVQIPFFSMSAGLVLQFGAQNIITSFLVGRSPKYLYSVPTILLWSLALSSYGLIGYIPAAVFWEIYFGLTIAMMVLFDVRVVIGLCQALGIHAFSIKKVSE